MWETGEVHTGVWLGNLREKDHLEDLDRWKVIVKMDFQAVGGEAWTGLIWLRIGTG
jgi:hypothetical protein